MKTILSILTAALVAGVAYAPPVGQTSEWGIVITPCAWCGATNNLEVHHVYCQHLWPELSRNTNNMVVLCRRCHFTVGHKNNWTNSFTNVINIIEVGKK
jgi:hypothetical protein